MEDKIRYVVALVAAFAKRYSLTEVQAEKYLSRYGGLEVCDLHYGIMHTLSFRDNVEYLAIYCRRNGGRL